MVDELHLHDAQGVVGSNPARPTREEAGQDLTGPDLPLIFGSFQTTTSAKLQLNTTANRGRRSTFAARDGRRSVPREHVIHGLDRTAGSGQNRVAVDRLGGSGRAMAHHVGNEFDGHAGRRKKRDGAVA